MLNLEREILDRGNDGLLLRALHGRPQDQKQEGVQLTETLHARGVLAHYQGVGEGYDDALAQGILEMKKREKGLFRFQKYLSACLV